MTQEKSAAILPGAAIRDASGALHGLTEIVRKALAGYGRERIRRGNTKPAYSFSGDRAPGCRCTGSPT